MMRRFPVLGWAVLLGCLTIACGGGGSGSSSDAATPNASTPGTTVPVAVTPTLVDMGIADYSNGAKSPFARNPWDMTYFDGRIYVAQGNSDNDGSPDGNAGPMKIVSFVPGTTGFRYEGYGTSSTLPEEQINVIKVIDGSLYIPGHDPQLDWTIRTLYKRAAGGSAWQQYRSTNAAEGDSWGVHCYDIIGFAGKLFSCGYAYGVSSDGGTTWSDVGSSARCTALFTVGGKLYGATYEPGFSIDEYNPQTGLFEDRSDVYQSRWAWLVPDIQLADPLTTSLKIVRPVSIGTRSIYLAGYGSSDHQTATVDVFLARSFEKGAFDVVRTTPSGERPWDLLVRGSVPYLLTSQKTGTGVDERFTLTIWKGTTDLTGWTVLYQFPGQKTFARSFEEVNGDFYLGLGTDDGAAYETYDVPYTTGIKADSGRILWVKTHG